MSVITKGSVERSTSLKGNVQTNTIIWTIHHFRSILLNNDVGKILSPKHDLSQSTIDPWKFELMMQLDRIKEPEQQYIEIKIYYLTSKSDVFESVQMNIIFDKDWDQYYGEYQAHSVVVTSKNREIVEANKWHHITDLLNESTDIKYLLESKHTTDVLLLMEDGSLRLSFIFEVTIKNDKEDLLESISSQAPTQPPATQPPATQLIKDLESLFIDCIYSDVLIKSADDEEFKVHKGMLASRSPVLRAHFEHNFTESITNIVESPLESVVLREVLSFIYTDRAKIDEFPEKLLAAANYYQLSELKIRCGDAIHKNLTVDNAIETLQLADLYKINTLKQQILDFIKYNGPFSVIIKTEGWNKLQSVDLIKEICDYCN